MSKWHKEAGVYLYDHDEYTRLKVYKYTDKRGWRGYVLHILECQKSDDPFDYKEPPYYCCVKYLNLNSTQLPEAKIKALDILQKYQTGELA